MNFPKYDDIVSGKRPIPKVAYHLKNESVHRSYSEERTGISRESLFREASNKIYNTFKGEFSRCQSNQGSEEEQKRIIEQATKYLSLLENNIFLNESVPSEKAKRFFMFISQKEMLNYIKADPDYVYSYLIRHIELLKLKNLDNSFIAYSQILITSILKDKLYDYLNNHNEKPSSKYDNLRKKLYDYYMALLNRIIKTNNATLLASYREKMELLLNKFSECYLIYMKTDNEGAINSLDTICKSIVMEKTKKPAVGMVISEQKKALESKRV